MCPSAASRLAAITQSAGGPEFVRPLQAVLAEILEERVASSRGRRVPRGVKRKMSGYKLRPRTPQPAVRIDFAAAIRIIK